MFIRLPSKLVTGYGTNPFYAWQTNTARRMQMSSVNQTDAEIMPTIFNPAHLHDPTPNGYSTAVITPATGRLAFISGQGGQDTRGVFSPDFGAQVAQAYANLGAVIDALGAKPTQVVKLTVFVVDHDMAKLGILTENMHRMFGASLPAQTLIAVPKLAIDTMLFEVEAVVALR
jgi:enamine deaminase RidA (YjgF/YER057c/UK114 family)